MAALKRLGRYLLGSPRVITKFEYQEEKKGIEAWTDTDYAGCMRTRKSTSGGILKIGEHIIKSWSTTQSVISLSSGEAEYYGMVRGASMGIGLRAVLEDLGVKKVNLEVKTDAAAAVGIANRQGLGKVRHLETSQLWLQGKVADGEIEITKVKGEENVADALTKHVNAEKVNWHLEVNKERVE